MAIMDSFKKWASRWGSDVKGNNVEEVISDFADKLPFGVKTEMVEIVPEQSVTGVFVPANEWTPIDMRYAEDAFMLDKTLDADGKYYVKINGAFRKLEFYEEQKDGDRVNNRYFVDYGTRTGLSINTLWGDGGEVSEYAYSVDFPATDGETITLAIYEEKEIVQPLDPKFVGASDVVIETTDNGGSWTCTHTFDELVNMYWNAPVQLAKTIIFYDLYTYGRAYVGRPYRINVNEFADEEGVEYIAFECEESRCNVKITPDGIYSNSEPA